MEAHRETERRAGVSEREAERQSPGQRWQREEAKKRGYRGTDADKDWERGEAGWETLHSQARMLSVGGQKVGHKRDLDSWQGL